MVRHEALATIEPEDDVFLPLTGKNILVVDDHESNVLVTTLLLKEFGCICDVAINGHEAIELFQVNKYDAILMDIQMPGMSGLEAAQAIRNLEDEISSMNIPIIALTAHVQPANKIEALNAGMNDFLAKPYDSHELRRKLELYL